MDWTALKSTCKIAGGNLASIHTSDENEFVNRMRKFYAIGEMWTGGCSDSGGRLSTI